MSKRIEYLQQLLATAPDDTFVLFALAKEYENADNRSLALDFYQRLLTVDPNYVGLYYHLGKLLEQTDKQDSALHVYKQGMEVARKAGDMHALAELNGARLNLEDE